jgi:hypothetical protein
MLSRPVMKPRCRPDWRLCTIDQASTRRSTHASMRAENRGLRSQGNLLLSADSTCEGPGVMGRCGAAPGAQGRSGRRLTRGQATQRRVFRLAHHPKGALRWPWGALGTHTNEKPRLTLEDVGRRFRIRRRFGHLAAGHEDLRTRCRRSVQPTLRSKSRQVIGGRCHLRRAVSAHRRTYVGRDS